MYCKLYISTQEYHTEDVLDAAKKGNERMYVARSRLSSNLLHETPYHFRNGSIREVQIMNP